MFVWRDRFKAFGIHFLISLGIAALAALLVFWVWYPYPYRDLSGGRELFTLLITVDVILGPLLTFSIFNRSKSRRALAFDFTAIGLTQLAALGYGLYVVFVARPVHLVFEYDRFRVVHAIEVPEELLPKTPAGIDALPLTGPTLLSLRRPTRDEKMATAMAEMAGAPLSARPDFWQPYEMARTEVLQHAKPASELKARFAAHARLIDQGIRASGRPVEKLRYLPLVARKEFWTAFIDQDSGQVVAAIALDSF
jgi:hypothetical protein